jgi:hypothetical protein
MQDLRTRQRTECMVPGRIFCTDSAKTFDCIIWDISETGARLGVTSGDLIPDEIRIKTEFSTRPRLARVLWRERKEIGVQLLDPS